MRSSIYTFCLLHTRSRFVRADILLKRYFVSALTVFAGPVSRFVLSVAADNLGAYVGYVAFKGRDDHRRYLFGDSTFRFGLFSSCAKCVARFFRPPIHEYQNKNVA